MSEHAQYAEKEETIRDRLVLGLQDQELSQKLQLESDLTLDKAVTIARQQELVKTQIKEQRHGAAAAAVDSFSGGQHQFTRGGRPSRRAKSKHAGTGTLTTQSCTRCGTKHDKGNCRAKGQKCHKCQKFSHFARCCKTKAVSQVEADSQPQAQGAYFVDSVGGGSENPRRVTLGLCGRNVPFKIDTGADVNVVSKRMYDSFTRKPTLQPTNLVLHSPGGVMKVLGQSETATTKNIPLKIFVTDSEIDSLLSRETASAMNLVKRVGSVFAEVKCEPVKIKMKNDARPYSVTTARRIPIPLLGKVEKELKRMKDNGVIEEVTEPTEWVSPIVPVLKPSGDVRICVDLKKLNQSVERERYVIPTVDEIVHQLRGSSVFSKLDAASGFWQIPLDPETAKLTTLITPFGRYFMKRLPFGISSAPEIFQRTMNELLRGIDGVIIVILPSWKNMNCYWVVCSRDWKKLVFNSVLRSVSTGSQRSPSVADMTDSSRVHISSAKMVFVLMTRRSQQWST